MLYHVSEFAGYTIYAEIPLENIPQRIESRVLARVAQLVRLHPVSQMVRLVLRAKGSWF